jgi:hypothetical protein
VVGERLPDPEPRTDPKRPSKQDVVIAMLRQPEGATVPEKTPRTVWRCQPVTLATSSTGSRGRAERDRAPTLKKKLGLPLASAKEERGRVYRIEPAGA